MNNRSSFVVKWFLIDAVLLGKRIAPDIVDGTIFRFAIQIESQVHYLDFLTDLTVVVPIPE